MLGCQLPDARRWVLLRMTRISDFPIKKALWTQTQTLGIEQQSRLTEKNTHSSHKCAAGDAEERAWGQEGTLQSQPESASAPGLPKKCTGVKHHVQVTSAHWELEQPSHNSQPCISSPLRWRVSVSHRLLTHQEKQRQACGDRKAKVRQEAVKACQFLRY